MSCNMLQRLHNDIIVLVYRELHRCHIGALNCDFKRLFVPFWDDDRGFGISSYVVANYRNGQNYKYIFQRIRFVAKYVDPNTHIEISISKHVEVFYGRLGIIPDNY